MMLSFLDFNHIFVSFFYPITFVTFTPQEGTPIDTSSGTGAGASIQYGLNSEIFLTAGYSLNLSLQNKNVFLSGWEAGARYYLLGGSGTPEKSAGHDGFLAPKYSFYVSSGIAGRSFDISSQASKRTDIIIDTNKTRTFNAQGSYLSVTGGAGVETLLLSPRIRVGVGAIFGMSISSSTSISTTETQLQLSVGYQI